MKRGLLAPLFLFFALAQPFPEALQSWLAQDGRLQAALREVQSRQVELENLRADRDAPPLSVQRAAERLEMASARLRVTRVEAEQRFLVAYSELLLSRQALAIKQKELQIAQMRMQGARLRRQAGAISLLELENAQAALSRSELEFNRAQERLAGEKQKWPDLRAEYLPLPELLTDTASPYAAKVHPRLLEAQIQVREAEREVALSQGPDTSEFERKIREGRLEEARRQLREVESELGDQMISARKRYQFALTSLRNSDLGYQRSLAQLQTARERFSRGVISRLELAQAELVALEAEDALLGSKVEVWKAYFALLLVMGGAR